MCNCAQFVILSLLCQYTQPYFVDSCSGGARFEAPWPGLIARPAFVCCGTCPPRGHSIASVARSAGLHPLRISPYARAAGSRDATVFSVTLQYLSFAGH